MTMFRPSICTNMSDKRRLGEIKNQYFDNYNTQKTGQNDRLFLQYPPQLIRLTLAKLKDFQLNPWDILPLPWLATITGALIFYYADLIPFPNK